MSAKHVVVGCGVIGLTTALELLRRGEQVTLIDSADHEGMGTSFANGGLLTPSMSDPWNSPGVHRHLLTFVLSSKSALKIKLRALPSLMTWGPKFLLNSRPGPHQVATLANLDLSIYTLDVMRELRSDYGLTFDGAERGSIKIFRSQEALDTSLALTTILKDHGLAANIVDRQGAVDVEPCLAPISDQLAGGIYYPDDATGDAHLFCRAAARVIAEQGGTFRYGERVIGIETSAGRVTGVRLQNDVLQCDSLIVATGVASPALVSSLGVKLAVKPVKGYSITYSIQAPTPMPGMPIVDDANHIAITPLGTRLRAAGTAEFAGNNTRIESKRVDALTTAFRTIYPKIATAATIASGQPWTGLRPVAADGRPYIGPAPIKGLWINTGHGHLGWTLAAGSARLLADLMSGSATAVDPSPFALAR